MTVTLNLSPHVEQAFIGEATARGLTPDEFISEVLLTYTARRADASSDFPSVISDIIDLIPQGRDLHNFGL